MYLPWELIQERLLAYPLPVSPALQCFHDIAWDGVDSIDSAWDSCEVGCQIPVKENRLCKGNDGSSDNNGANLRNYDWTTPFCDQGDVFNRTTEALPASSRRLSRLAHGGSPG